MHIMQLRVERDPITGREISKECWNGHHDNPGSAMDGACQEVMCKCLCHERTPDSADETK